ncbi:TROVE domain-containing protein [Roseimicrobium sp. ORNL1]|uniref:TROVE domain-containing protein n=1 Tax=Roseimicrobium sp. ORNL1 TaxID=2711231 RepID=UPI0013E133BD|nr:TROVE domain-containing protein [Roseimicrobium sp. ORNL1]QIF04740.1 TROVE domain-containing protein [Roseimicrobium sp. ORNL1]
MKFNILKTGRARGNTLNKAGGEAYVETAKLELASLLLTSILGDQYYRTANAATKRIKELVAQTGDKKFVAKAALYARKEAGMRSVSHLVASELAHAVKGEPWTATFYDRVVHRPDDALETLACYVGTYGRPIPNALKKGLGKALARFDEYQIAKYRKTNAEISLVDLVNLVHPPHTEALRKLVNGTLAPAETWETKLTQAGANAESDAELADLKKDAWTELIRMRKLGYFALLRNLRNIVATAPDAIDDAIVMLTDERLIKKSLVMPFRFTTALEALQGSGLPGVSRVLAALSDAVDASLANVPRYEGKTLVALDGSGSMMGKPIKIGALFTATLAKANDADVLLFSNDAKYVSINKRDSTLTVANWLERQCASAGTNFHAIFNRAASSYDRIIILSDMQGWIGQYTPVASFDAWKAKYGASPKVFSFDLQGYGTLQFPQRDVYCLAGFSDKTFDTLQRLESDQAAFLKQIEAIEL